MSNHNFEKLLETVSRSDRALKATENAKKKWAQRRREAIENMGKLVREGKSTGDIVEDFVICTYKTLPSDAPDLVEKFKGLQNQISEHIGEFVLLISREEKYTGCGGRDRYIGETYFLGVLADKDLVFNFDLEVLSEDCALPTKKHIEFKNLRREFEESDGNIKPPMLQHFGTHFGEPLKGRSSPIPGLEEVSELKALIGDDEVLKWLEHRLPEELWVFEKMATALGKSISFPEAEKFKKGRRKEVMDGILFQLTTRNNLQCSSSDARTEKKLQEINQSIENNLRELVELGYEDDGLQNIQGLCEDYGVEITA